MSQQQNSLSDDGWCFACGKHNPHGLNMKIEFSEEDSLAFCRLSLAKRFKGWDGIAHGGVVATMMDEIMAHAVIHFKAQAVTGTMESRYRAPVPLDTELMVTGWVSGGRGRLVQAQATVERLEDAKLLAEAKGSFLLVEK